MFATTDQEQIIEDIKWMVEERIEAWYDVFRKLPSKILFYRDGVGEDQYRKVRDHEISEVKRAYAELHSRRGITAPLVDPLATFIVVGKRHHTRFFPAQKKDAVQNEDNYNLRRDGSVDLGKTDMNSNLKPGLVVDQIITGPRSNTPADVPIPKDRAPDELPYDFYLQSHLAIKGTARSAHYVVLENRAGFTAGELQNLVRKPPFIETGDQANKPPL